MYKKRFRHRDIIDVTKSFTGFKRIQLNIFIKS